MSNSHAHTRGPVRGVSSYDKICAHLRKTGDFSDYLVRVSKALDNVKVSGWEFHAGGEDYSSDPAKKKNVAPPTWNLVLDWGKMDGAPERLEKVFSDSGQLSKWDLSLMTICDENSANKIVLANFDTKACPTYFCKKEKLLGRNKDGDRDNKLDNKWVAFVRSEVREVLGDKIARTQDRLRQEMQDAIDSDQFKKEMTEFHERGIIEEIKLVLHKFHSVAKPHILKAAMDEYVMHEIMESIDNMTGTDVDSFYDGNFISPVGSCRRSEVDNLLSHAY